MSTVSYGVVVTATTKRDKNRLIGVTDSLPDVDLFSMNKQALAKSQSISLTPKRLLVVSTNGVKLLIRITVGSSTITLPFSTLLALPFDEDVAATVVIENPADNDTDLPAVVSYLTV